jgi:hypothetical protein
VVEIITGGPSGNRTTPPQSLRIFTLHPLIHTQVGCTVAQSVELGTVTFD